MNLEQKFKEETGFDVGKIHDIGTTYYSNDYVEWLEKQLSIHVVSSSNDDIEIKQPWNEENPSHCKIDINCVHHRCLIEGKGNCDYDGRK